MKITTLIIFLSFVCFQYSSSTILTVPANYSSIQDAINASVNGDTIAVSPGTYMENINFRGKNVLLTSLFFQAGDTSYINSTIINGSSPANSDTASCVIFNSGEDSTAIIQGFTITGGAGTKWNDIHGAGVYREGGGILIELSSPTVRHNIITNNIVTNLSGVVETGGGGIRIGDGNPKIYNNVISFNEARYGPGIVLNYAAASIRNNLIVSNTGGQVFSGGAGIWIVEDLGNEPKEIINNTIVNNYSSLGASGAGGIFIWLASNVIIKNNIIWGNLPAQQIRSTSSIPSITYNNIQGGASGIGNINQDPLFDFQNYFLTPTSPCIDAGDTLSIYSDIEDSLNPGNALLPSLGTLRNDMGAYGGPLASILPLTQTAVGLSENLTAPTNVLLFPNPFRKQTTITLNKNLNKASLEIYSSNGKKLRKYNNLSGSQIALNREKLRSGIYYFTIINNDDIIARGKFIIIN